MSFNVIFIIMFAVFGAVLVGGGIATRKWIKDSSDYLLAGREVSLLINIFGVAAIGFAGTSITVMPGLTVSGGFWSSFSFSVAYLLAGLMLYGFVFAKFVRRCGAQTLPEWLGMRFDSRTRTIITVTTVLGLLGILANNIVSMAMVVSGFTGWNYLVTSSIVFILFLFFTFVGGFWAVTLTDFMQMIIGLVALPLLLIFLMAKFGGWAWPATQWAGAAGIMNGGITGTHLPILSLKYPSVLMFFVLFGCFLVWGNNYYWLRVATCRSERVAKKSYIYAAILLLVVNYFILQLVGMYTGAASPEEFAMFGEGGTASPFSAFGVALKLVPTVIASFALLAALAASVSTATTAHMGATSTTVRDIYARIIKPNATAKELVKPSKYIMLILGVLVWALTFYPGGPLYLFAFANAWLGPPAVLVFLGAFWPRMTKQGAFWGATISITSMMIVTILSLTKVWEIAAFMHQGAFGLIISLTLSVVISLLTQPKYYGKSTWTLNPNNSSTAIAEVSDKEKDILILINKGYVSLGEITDFLGVDSFESNEIIESLDQKRLIIRDKIRGAGFYSFSITQAGKSVLPSPNAAEAAISADRASFEDIKLLHAVNGGKEHLLKFSEESDLSSLKFSVLVSKLIREGYLNEGGLMKRKISMTEKGRKLLSKHKELLNF